MKLFHPVSLIIAFSVLSTTGASALVNYSQDSYGDSCVRVSRTLSYGARGYDVTQLQQFLATQDFPGGGSWMISGFFGRATTAAVRNFQLQQHLISSGVVDFATRSAIAQVTCGVLSVSTNAYAQNIPWNGYNNSDYLYGYNNGNLVSLNITSLSQNTGTVGAQVTIYGTGFDAVGNTINFGPIALTNVPSNGNSMTFIVPSYTGSGNVNITVRDSRGTSNALIFTMNNYGYSCGSNYFYAYGSCGCNTAYGNSYYGSNYPYNNTQNYGTCGGSTQSGNTSAPRATYLSPNSGAVGTALTLFGSGFTSSGNTVHFGTGIISDLHSPDGLSVSFTVPSVLTGYGSQNTGLGLYNVSVTNGLGFSTNVLPYTVTGLNSPGGVPTITSITGPTSIAAGTLGTWTITLNNPSNSALTVMPNWGDANTYTYGASPVAQSVYAPGIVTLTFTHTYTTSATYTILFTVGNGSGQQTNVSTTVVVSGSTYGTGAPLISYLSPTSAHVGSQVTIYGSGFTLSSTIMFGNGTVPALYANNGNTITFTVPSYVTPVCGSLVCPQYAQSITPGTYNVSVINANGTSNTLPLSVF